jgi:hypothetical protein
MPSKEQLEIAINDWEDFDEGRLTFIGYTRETYWNFPRLGTLAHSVVSQAIDETFENYAGSFKDREFGETVYASVIEPLWGDIYLVQGIVTEDGYHIHWTSGRNIFDQEIINEKEQEE